MRLPWTRPVVGSVPCGRRKSRMCGSGLRVSTRAHKTQLREWCGSSCWERYKRVCVSQGARKQVGGTARRGEAAGVRGQQRRGNGISVRVWVAVRTCGWRSGPIRGSAARRGHATPIRRAGDPWGRSSRRASAGSHACARWGAIPTVSAGARGGPGCRRPEAAGGGGAGARPGLPQAKACEWVCGGERVTGTRNRHRSTSRSTRCPGTS